MNTYANRNEAKKGELTLTPDGKPLKPGRCACAKSCGNRDNGTAFCRCGCHLAQYQEIAALRADLAVEYFRQDMTALLLGDGRKDVMAFACALAGNIPEAEELLQGACFQALRRAAQYDRSRPLVPWLKAIARNLHTDAWRRRRRLLSLDAPVEGIDRLGDALADPGAEGGANVEARMELEGGKAVLFSAIAGLSVKYRRVVVLCDLEGLEYAAAARELGVAIGTVRSRLCRARAVLAQKVRPSDS